MPIYLVYANTESGALNEGFSDIWAACVEAYTDPTKQRWLIFEETTIPFPFHERNMANPVDGRIPQPDTYGGPHWGDLGSDPHINSGVLNHWFFLLSDGGNATNGIGNAFAVTGIGIQDAEKIAYLTEQNLPSGATYQNARIESVNAAAYYFGANSCQVRAVENAWFAVGVGAASTVQPVFASTISNPTQTCGGTTLTINAIPPGSTVSGWTSNNNVIAQVVSFSGLSADIILKGNGSATLTATVVPPANSCYSTYTVTKLVNSSQEFGGGESITDNVSGSGVWFCIGAPFNAYAPVYNGATNYLWTPSPNISIGTGNGTSTVSGQSLSGGAGLLTVAITTYCGNQTITKPYYIGTQFDAARVPFEVVSLNCHTGAVVLQADAFRSPTNYYWTITEYDQTNGVLANSSFTSTSNVLNYNLNTTTDHGTVCLRIDVGGCGISEQRCVNFSVPCRNVRMMQGSQIITYDPKGSLQSKPEILIFPNPVKDVVHISLPETVKGNIIVEISDALGRRVLSRKVTSVKNSIQVPVDFIRGYYFVKLMYNNKTVTGKFIKE